MTEEKKDFTLRKGPPNNRKARPMLIDEIIDKARIDVIRADLELTFVKDVKAKYPKNTPFLELLPSEIELEMHYNYYFERLSYFKALRDKMRDKEEAKRIIQEVEKTTPAEVTVITK